MANSLKKNYSSLSYNTLSFLFYRTFLVNCLETTITRLFLHKSFKDKPIPFMFRHSILLFTYWILLIAAYNNFKITLQSQTGKFK